jgi:hypothetical protein
MSIQTFDPPIFIEMSKSLEWKEGGSRDDADAEAAAIESDQDIFHESKPVIT